MSHQECCKQTLVDVVFAYHSEFARCLLMCPQTGLGAVEETLYHTLVGASSRYLFIYHIGNNSCFFSVAYNTKRKVAGLCVHFRRKLFFCFASCLREASPSHFILIQVLAKWGVPGFLLPLISFFPPCFRSLGSIISKSH